LKYFSFINNKIVFQKLQGSLPGDKIPGQQFPQIVYKTTGYKNMRSPAR